MRPLGQRRPAERALIRTRLPAADDAEALERGSPPTAPRDGWDVVATALPPYRLSPRRARPHQGATPKTNAGFRSRPPFFTAEHAEVAEIVLWVP